MSHISLAVKYRPMTFDEVVGQEPIKIILRQQLESKTTKNAYLFCGGAGTGKTTCARIFANEINQHRGNPIEIDAASNSGVDDVREIIQQARTKSMTSEYKVFIVDEVHSISSAGWQAFLKLIEEPPAKSVFIFCTTDPQKIPKTILSRVQRYDFQRIPQEAVVGRLLYILKEENIDTYEPEAIEYLAKIADGGMRDAITLMDKCISYSPDLTVENVVKALGVVDYEVMIDLTRSLILDKDIEQIISIIEKVHRAGKDLKQFIKSFVGFILDLNKYICLKSFEYLEMPSLYESSILPLIQEPDKCIQLLDTVIKLQADIKWETSPKAVITATLILECVK